jgi:rRNA maturation endonuclease Nob1
LIIDSSGLFHIRNAYAITEMASMGYRLVTTSLVVNEVKDTRSQALLGILNMEVIDIDADHIKQVKLENSGLSDTDASIVALALDLASQGIEVAVVTDDVGLIKALRRRIRGIRIITVNVK